MNKSNNDKHIESLIIFLAVRDYEKMLIHSIINVIFEILDKNPFRIYNFLIRVDMEPSFDRS